MGAETVSIAAEGGRTLAGYCVEPLGAPRGVVLLIHGWGSSGSDMLSWAAFLARDGYASLAVDLRGQGGSPHEPVVTMPDLGRDIRSAWEWMADRPEWEPLPKALLGHSMGGAASLYAMVRLGISPQALILSAAFARVEVITAYVLRKWRIPTVPFQHVVKAVWNRRTGIELKGLEPETLIAGAGCPVLVTHGTADPVVPAGELRRLLARAPLATESVEIPGGSHSDLHAFPEYRAAVVSFLGRYL